jgi:CDP-diacylglycerol--serine O-phosphatidyltransferase
MYQAGLSDLGRIGWVICFMFMACGALRLARFNVQSAIGQGSGDFTGLPIPMAAGVIACFVSLWKGVTTDPESLGIFSWIAGILNVEAVRLGFFGFAGVGLAVAMVTNVPYRSHKTLKFQGIKPFKLLVISVALLSLVAFQPELLGFMIFFGYAISGPIEWILGWTKLVEDEDIFETDSNLIERNEVKGE